MRADGGIDELHVVQATWTGQRLILENASHLRT